MQQVSYVNEEPELTELFSDPVLQAILKCDGLTTDDVKKVVRDYQINRASKSLNQC